MKNSDNGNYKDSFHITGFLAYTCHIYNFTVKHKNVYDETISFCCSIYFSANF